VITQLKIYPSLPMTTEDYLISRRWGLLVRLNYLESDRRDSALMFALTDATNEKRNIAVKKAARTIKS